MEIKSELVMCPKGHYYNKAVHAACPICGGSAVSADVGSFAPTEAPGATAGPAAGSFAPTEAPGAAARPTQGSFAPTEAPGAVRSSSNSAGPVNPFSVQTTIGGDLAPAGKVNPVVGWLVCIDGPSRGTDWRIHVGYNYIGREIGDIHIQGDNQISREKHAMVAFYAKNLTYYVGPAEGRNIVELNDQPVFSTMELKNYDVITIGTTKLMFIGLCGEHFTWGQEKGNDE